MLLHYGNNQASTKEGTTSLLSAPDVAIVLTTPLVITDLSLPIMNDTPTQDEHHPGQDYYGTEEVTSADFIGHQVSSVPTRQAILTRWLTPEESMDRPIGSSPDAMPLDSSIMQEILLAIKSSAESTN